MSKEARKSGEEYLLQRHLFRRLSTGESADEQFLRLRDRIEQCASRKFLAREFEGAPPGIILRSMDFRS